MTRNVGRLGTPEDYDGIFLRDDQDTVTNPQEHANMTHLLLV